jgi:hypothetical protein
MATRQSQRKTMISPYPIQKANQLLGSEKNSENDGYVSILSLNLFAPLCSSPPPLLFLSQCFFFPFTRSSLLTLTSQPSPFTLSQFYRAGPIMPLRNFWETRRFRHTRIRSPKTLWTYFQNMCGGSVADIKCPNLSISLLGELVRRKKYTV